MPTNVAPFSQLVGPLDVYIAPNTGTAESKPDVDTTPAGNWVEFGKTDGDQSISHPQTLEYFRDNSSPAARKAARAEEDVIVTLTLVDLTLEHYARVIGDVSDVSSAAGPPAIKKLPLKRGFDLTEYSLLLRGEAHSPYGDFPAQYYIPRCVIDGEPEAVFGKGARPGLEVELHVLEDGNQSSGDELGWLEAQTS